MGSYTYLYDANFFSVPSPLDPYSARLTLSNWTQIRQELGIVEQLSPSSYPTAQCQAVGIYFALAQELPSFALGAIHK